MASGIPAHFADTGAGVLGLRTETLERPTFESECEMAFRGEHAAGNFAGPAAQLEQSVLFGEILQIAWEVRE